MIADEIASAVPGRASRSSGITRRFAASAGARLVVLPVTGACSLLTAHAVSGSLGPAAYALFMLVSTLPFLLPTPDLGMGAALMNAAAALPARDAEFVWVYRRVRRLLLAFGGGLLVVDLVLGLTGVWTAIVGARGGVRIDWAITVAIGLFAISIITSGGSDVLQGLGKNHLVAYFQAIIPVSTYAVAGFGVLFGVPFPIILGLSTIGLPITSIVLSLVARRDARVRHAVAVHPSPTARAVIFALAVPAFLVIVTSVLTIQPGRLILSHESTVAQMAALAAAYTLFLPILSVVQTAGRSLWPEFAAARSAGRTLFPIVRSGLRLSLLIGVGGLLGFTLLGPPIAQWATHGLVATPFALYVVLGVGVLVVALHQVSAMYLTDVRGMRFQSVTSLIACVLSLGIGIGLAPSRGALGVAIGLVVGLGAGQVVPCAVRVLLEWRGARASEPARGAVAVGGGLAARDLRQD